MIAKDKAARAVGGDVRAAAGAEAERQMGFYLRRGFEKPVLSGFVSRGVDVRVFNDLRVVVGMTPQGREDAVQVDHLVMHPWGRVIVESKSVSEEVKVNRRGEFQRRYRGKWEGIPSPIEQARRQGEGLRGLLQEHREALRDRKAFGLLQGGFKHCPIDVLVAVSDNGSIRREGCEAAEVVKADQVVGRILEIVERHRKGSPLLAERDEAGSGDWSMTEAELARVTAFLLERHVELGPAGNRNGQTAARLEALACEKCRSVNVQMVPARYGHCLKCDECGRFTPVDFACRACGKKAKISKKGPEFRRVCGACGAEGVFWRNRE